MTSNRTLPVVATAIALTVGSTAIAAATPTNGDAGGTNSHMEQFDDQTLEEMTDLMDDGASVGQMHRWMAEQGIEIGQMHGGMAAEDLPPGAMHRSMAGR